MPLPLTHLLAIPLRAFSNKSKISKSQYVFVSDVYAGNDNSNDTVTIKNGVTYELEASGTVVLNNGFVVEKGAEFAVYPSCF